MPGRAAKQAKLVHKYFYAENQVFYQATRGIGELKKLAAPWVYVLTKESYRVLFFAPCCFGVPSGTLPIFGE
jgi:hypothetical protein